MEKYRLADTQSIGTVERVRPPQGIVSKLAGGVPLISQSANDIELKVDH